MNISYQIDPYLVRGLDYYSQTVFEIQCDSLGSQNATQSVGGRDMGGGVKKFSDGHHLPTI